jgi:hypothetical protein
MRNNSQFMTVFFFNAKLIEPFYRVNNKNMFVITHNGNNVGLQGNRVNVYLYNTVQVSNIYDYASLAF